MKQLPHIATYECRRGFSRLDVAFYSDGQRFVIKHRETRRDKHLKAPATNADMGTWKTNMDTNFVPATDGTPEQYAEGIIRNPRNRYARFATIERIA